MVFSIIILTSEAFWLNFVEAAREKGKNANLF